jgi:multicomponent Na+:H+ antiporter subunit E
MSLSSEDGGTAWERAVARAVAFFCLWLVVFGASPADLPVGAIAALLATWISRRLLPPGAWRVRPLAVSGVVLRFLGQSVVAGSDVAWRALEPRPRLRPGLVPCSLRTAAGPARSAFCAFASLMPGTLPAGFDASGRLLVHCLDVGQPVAAELSAEERRLGRAFGRGDDG